MPANNSENNSFTESAITFQPFVVMLGCVIASLLIAILLLPIGIPNLTFALSGDTPRIYWYLSRSAGFIGLTILWIAMALGLSITSKLARLWPSAPTAYAIHEYASILGLAFTVFHGLVLMGDHFVDFSFPHLILPFSISYKTLWVGLGQVSFYVWLIVVISFYIRPLIGQKTWRLIHYVNFATYAMGIIHGVYSGTDSNTKWAYWYYLISGTSLLVLLAYRIYDAVLKQSSLRELVFQRVQNLSRIWITVTYKPTAPKINSVLSALPRKQARALIVPTGKPNTPAPISQPARTIIEKYQDTIVAKKPQLRVAEKRELEPQPPMPTNTPVLTAENIFKEPTTRPIEELQNILSPNRLRQVH